MNDQCEFTSASELREHYRRIHLRLSPPAPRLRFIPPPPPPPPPPPRPKKKRTPAPRFRLLSRSSDMEIMREAIFFVVHREYGISKTALRSPTRAHSLVEGRAVVSWLAVELAQASLPRIGRWLHRDHTTVLHHVHAVRDRMRDDENEHRKMHAIAARVRELCNAARPQEG